MATSSTGTAVDAAQEEGAQRFNSNSSLYEKRTNPRDDPTQQLTKPPVDFLIEQLKRDKSNTLTAYLGAVTQLQLLEYSCHRSCSPDATRVAGIRTWNKLGRFINRGQKGILHP